MESKVNKGARDVSQLIIDMGETLYAALINHLSEPFQKAIDDAIDAQDTEDSDVKKEAEEAQKRAEDTLAAAKEGWKKLADAIAEGIITYALSGMEITIRDKTGPGGQDAHIHPIVLSTPSSDWSVTSKIND